MKALVSTAITLGLLALGAGALVAQSGHDLFQQALVKERTDGDIAAAIALYQTIVEKHSTDRALVARALVQMGQAYEKLGRSEALKTYERVVREFGDQKESVATARARLSSLLEPFIGLPTMTTRRVWSTDPNSARNIGRTDGLYIPFRGEAPQPVPGRMDGLLVVRNLATGEDRHFTNLGPFDPSLDTGIESAVVSPDGRYVVYAFWNGPYDLRVVPLSAATSGAPPRILLSKENLSSKDLVEAYPMDWSPDGKHVLAFLQKKDETYQLALISVADGSLRVLKSLGWRRPNGSFSPDGRYIAYDVQLQQNSPDRDIFALATDGSREATLVEYPGIDRVLGWAPDGKRLLFASNRTGSTGAWFIGVAEGRPQGSPELVKRDIGDITPLGSSRSGALYYTLQTGMQDVYIASLDKATGMVTAPPAPANPRRLGGYAYAAWSPDGQYLAYLSAGVRIRSMKTDEERQLSLSPNLRFGNQVRWGRLRWSPDGRSLLAFAVDDTQHQGIYRIDVQTGTVASIVLREQAAGTPTYGVWSADGKAIFYALNRSEAFAVTRSMLAAEGNHKFDPTSEDKVGIRVRDLETGRDTVVYRPALPSQINHVALSPDGRWLAFVSNRTIEIPGKLAKVEEDLLVIPATGGEPRELLQVHEGVTIPDALAVLEWTRDGEHLLYSRNRELWRISAKGGAAQKLGLATTSARETSLSVHPDGQRIAFTAGEPTQEVWVMENFWPAANAALLPNPPAAK